MAHSKALLSDLTPLRVTQKRSIRKDDLVGITDQSTKDELARRLKSSIDGRETAQKNIELLLAQMNKLNAKWPAITDSDGKKITLAQQTAAHLEWTSREGTTVKQFDEVRQN